MPAAPMTPKERFVTALQRKPLQGRVPHFELVFFLTMEAFGRVSPCHRNYSQWDQMEAKERRLHLEDMADIYIMTAERYEHDAIFIHPFTGNPKDFAELVNTVREKSGDRYFLMTHGDATFDIPPGDRMLDFSYRMADSPDGLRAEAQARLDRALADAEMFRARCGLDGFALCSDYCLNDGPFLSPNQFSEFVAPYLDKLIAGYRDMGFYSIKHTDGDIMPIVDQIIQCKPDALHSIDPQAGVDIAVIKERYGSEVCLCGNVNCGLMDTGTDEEVIASARYALEKGMSGGGYIFCTSNCIYTGMRLERYEMILDVWKKEGNYE